jgi:guanylate kinase
MVERLKSLMITGAPCTGKSTLTKYCEETWSLEKIPGHTTRAKRPNEFYGTDYTAILHF